MEKAKATFSSDSFILNDSVPEVNFQKPARRKGELLAHKIGDILNDLSIHPV